MHKTLISILFATVFAPAIAKDCVLQQRTTTTNAGEITEIRNVNFDVINLDHGRKRCMARIDGLVKGQWLRSYGDHTYDHEPTKVGCGVAVEVAKNNLLIRLNQSTIKTESVVVCRDDQKPKMVSTQLGNIVDDITQLRPHPTYHRTFYHQGQECRWFVEMNWTGANLQPINGIVCKLNPRQWIVVDKF